MDLELTVPELSPGDSADVETRPSRLKQWLNNLPMLNMSETSHQVHRALMITNRIQVDNATRLKLMEIYRDRVAEISQELRRQYAGFSLPLSEKNKLIAEQVRHFQTEMAFGYKHVIRNTYARYKPRLSGRHAAGLVLPIHRAIRYLTDTLLHSYQFYAPHPVGTLKEIHQLYRLAENHKIANTAVEDRLNEVMPRTDITQAYKKALLLELSDPYHLPMRVITKIDRYLDRWVGLARLTPATADHVEKNCQFLVNLDSDQAGHTYAGEPDLKDNRQFRLLNTLELARQIHGHLSELQSGQRPEHQGLGEDFFDKVAHDMLLRLITAWGVNPKRVFPRTTGIGGKMRLAIGLPAVSYHLNDGRRFMTSAEYMGPPRQRTRIGTLYAQPEANPVVLQMAKDKADPEPQYRYGTWELLDESAGGVALEKTGLDNLQLRVGEIVAMRPPEGKTGWEIGVVRWMRYVDSDRMEIGLQRLAPGATPVAIKTLDQDNKESEFMSGLLLPALPALHQDQTLLTPRGVFRTDHVIYMDDGRMLHRVRATKLMEITGSYEQFLFESLQA